MESVQHVTASLLSFHKTFPKFSILFSSFQGRKLVGEILKTGKTPAIPTV